MTKVSKDLKKTGYIVLVISIILIIGVGLYTGKLQEVVNGIPYLDKIGRGEVVNLPTLNNYDFSPPEIRDFGEKIIQNEDK